MKIVHVTQFFHPARGYQENHLSILQARDNHDVTIVCTDDLSLWGINKTDMLEMDTNFLKKHNVKIIRLKKFFEFSTRIFVFGLSNAINTASPNLLIIHGVALPISLQAMKWGAKNNTRMIVDDHMVQAGSFSKFSKIFYSQFKKFLPLYIKVFGIQVDKWIAVSDETKEFMLKNYGINSNIEVVPLGYDDNTVYLDKDGGKRWLVDNNLPTNLPYVLYIGKFDNMKNPIDLLESFKMFQNNNPQYKLLMVGDPSLEYKEKLSNKIKKLKMDSDVYMRNSISNDQIRKVFSIADVVVWPHGSSMAMLEAMVCLCPVVAPDIDVNRERLSAGKGVLFSENESVDLCEKIQYTIDNKTDITEKAYGWVINYNWKNLACKFLK